MLLKSGNHSVLVSPVGGSVLRWQWMNRDILFPFGMVQVGNKLKERGGSFFCFPYLGSAEPIEGSQILKPQHGFLRHSLLAVPGRSKDSVRFEGSLGGPMVNVAATHDGLQTSLHFTNNGPEHFPILPAIHPYFRVPSDGFTLNINGETLDAKDLQPLHRPEKSMVIRRVVEMPTEILLHGVGRVGLLMVGKWSHLVVWSDDPTRYICVEPVSGEPGTYGAENGRWLAPGEEIECTVKFCFEPE